MRTIVTFKSDAFNMSEPRDYYINPCCFGDDVAVWLLQETQKRGVLPIGEPRQEDSGWYITFRIGDVAYDFAIGFRPNDSDAAGDWIGWLERKRGLIGSLFGGRKRGIQAAATCAIHSVLSDSPLIQDIRWHVAADFDGGREDLGTDSP